MNRDFLKMEDFRRWFGNPNYEFVNINNIVNVKVGHFCITMHTIGFNYCIFPKTKYNMDLLESEGFDLE